MIYNIAGQPVRSLRDGVMESGWHSVVWDGRDGLWCGQPLDFHDAARREFFG